MALLWILGLGFIGLLSLGFVGAYADDFTSRNPGIEILSETNSTINVEFRCRFDDEIVEECGAWIRVIDDCDRDFMIVEYESEAQECIQEFIDDEVARRERTRERQRDRQEDFREVWIPLYSVLTGLILLLLIIPTAILCYLEYPS